MTLYFGKRDQSSHSVSITICPSLRLIMMAVRHGASLALRLAGGPMVRSVPLHATTIFRTRSGTAVCKASSNVGSMISMRPTRGTWA